MILCGGFQRDDAVDCLCCICSWSCDVSCTSPGQIFRLKYGSDICCLLKDVECIGMEWLIAKGTG